MFDRYEEKFKDAFHAIPRRNRKGPMTGRTRLSLKHHYIAWEGDVLCSLMRDDEQRYGEEYVTNKYFSEIELTEEELVDIARIRQSRASEEHYISNIQYYAQEWGCAVGEAMSIAKERCSMEAGAAERAVRKRLKDERENTPHIIDWYNTI